VLAVGRKKEVSADLRMSPKDDSVVEKAILNYPLSWPIKTYPIANFFCFQVSTQGSKQNKTNSNPRMNTSKVKQSVLNF